MRQAQRLEFPGQGECMLLGCGQHQLGNGRCVGHQDTLPEAERMGLQYPRTHCWLLDHRIDGKDPRPAGLSGLCPDCDALHAESLCPTLQETAP